MGTRLASAIIVQISEREQLNHSPGPRALEKEMEGPDEDAVENGLAVLEIQCATIKKMMLRKFETEARKALGPLPDKTSIPKEILKMSVYEFLERGGSFQAVLESLKQEKMSGMQPSSEALAASSSAGSQGHPHTENTNVAPTSDASNPVSQNSDFVTPAVGRMQALTKPEYTDNVTKRKPKPMEQVTVMACSDVSGSPVDEQTFIQLQLDQALEDVKTQLLHSTAKFPQKYRSQLMKSLRGIKNQVKMQENKFVTPAIGR